MKVAKQALAALSAILIIAALIGCASKPKVKVVELENKGSSMNVSTPEWIKAYTAHGISRVQAQAEFKDKYCIIGEESGVNKQFVIAWADSFSAQQRIGAMLRTNIASEYQARVQGAAQTTGGAGSTTGAGTASGEFKQEIDNVINAIVNVSYSGAQREADWWSLRRRYDADQTGVYSDEYTAYVLYTFPKAELNRQIARALETSISADSALYEITMDIARGLLLKSFDYIGAGDLEPPATPTQTPEQKKVVSASGPTGNVIIRNNSSGTGSIMSMVKIYSGYEAKGEPVTIYEKPVLGGQQADWDLAEGIYTVEVFLNGAKESQQPGLIGSGRTTIGVTAGNTFIADFSGGSISSFTKRN